MPGRTPLVSLPPTRSALAAPFVVIGQELRQIAGQPAPFFGGLLGTIFGCAALIAAMISLPSPAGAELEPLVIEFIPTSAISLGEVDGEAGSSPASEPDAGESGSSQSAAASVPNPNPATEPSTNAGPEHEPKPDPKPNPNPNPHPNPNPSPGSTTSPFGDPNAWSDLVGDGDPWAAAVIRALRSMKVPAWAGKIAADRAFAFRLVVCKDGSISDVVRKQSTGDADLDATLEHEISRVVLPRLPAAMAAQMPRSCATLSYQFTWSAAGVG